MAVVPTLFGTLAEGQNLQVMVDGSLQALQQPSVWRRWLDVGMPRMELTFATAIGRDRIEAAASVMDPDATKPLRSRNSAELLNGKIPTIGQKFKMDQAQMRQMEVLRMMPISDEARKNALLEKLYDDVSKCAQSVDKRIDQMLLNALSTLTVTVDATSNPDGVAFGTVDLLAKGYQKQGVPVVWTNAASSTPITDILKYTQFIYNTYGRGFTKILMPFNLWVNFMNSAEVIAKIQSFYNIGKANASFAVTEQSVNAFMAANRLPQIEIVQHVIGIEKDGIITATRPFNDNNIAFIPDGKLGTLEHAMSMEELHKVEGVNYAKYDSLALISKWRDNDPIAEWTGVEANAFPALNVDGIFILKTDTVQASFNTVGS